MSSTPKFYLKDRNSNGETAIQMRVHIKGKLFRYGIGKSIHPDLWDLSKQKPRNLTQKLIKPFLKENPNIKVDVENVNTRILNVVKSLKRQLAIFEDKNVQVDFDALKSSLDKEYKNIKRTVKNRKETQLNEFISNHLKDMENGKITFTTSNGSRRKYQRSTIKSYKEWKTQFDLYQKSRNRTLKFDHITIDFYNDYVDYFINKGVSTNHIGKQIKILKSLMNASLQRGLHSNNEFRRKAFKTLKEEVDHIYLTEEEVDSLFLIDLKSNNSLEIARDLFLIGCYTALRYSDCIRLSKSNVVEKDGVKCIEIITRKTSEKVIVPIRKELKVILERYDYNLPRTYEQRINADIKEVCKLAQINEPVTKEIIKGGMRVSKEVPKYELVMTHTARRTGATLMYKSGVSTIDLMKITGHKKESSLLRYIKISKEETAIRLSLNPFFSRKIK